MGTWEEGPGSKCRGAVTTGDPPRPRRGGLHCTDVCLRTLFDEMLRDNVQARKGEGARSRRLRSVSFKFCFGLNFCLLEKHDYEASLPLESAGLVFLLCPRNQSCASSHPPPAGGGEEAKRQMSSSLRSVSKHASTLFV